MVWTDLRIYRKGAPRPYRWIIVAQDKQVIERAVSDAESFFQTWHDCPREFEKMQWAGPQRFREAYLADMVYRLDPCPDLPRTMAELKRQGWTYLDAP